MKSNFRALSENDSDLLCELFRTQAKEQTAWVWQDRSPAFFALYEAMKKGSSPYSYYGALNEDGRLIASSGSVATELRWPVRGKTFRYETDYFVEEASRTQRVGGSLLEARLKNTYANNFSRDIYYAIENQPGLFTPAFTALWKQYGGDTIFPAESILHEIYLLPSSPQTHSHRNIEILPLKDAQDGELDRFIAGYERFHSKSALSALLTKDALRTLSARYPEAKLYLALDGQTEKAGGLALDMCPTRRFLWTGKPSLIQTRLMQTRSFDASEFKAGATFKNLILSFLWHEPDQESSLSSLIDSVYQNAFAMGYHALIARDVSEYLKPYEDQTLSYSRRILLTIHEQDQETHEIVEAALAKGARWTMEPALL